MIYILKKRVSPFGHYPEYKYRVTSHHLVITQEVIDLNIGEGKTLPNRSHRNPTTPEYINTHLLPEFYLDNEIVTIFNDSVVLFESQFYPSFVDEIMKAISEYLPVMREEKLNIILE